MFRNTRFIGVCSALLLALGMVAPLEAATDLTQNVLSARSFMTFHFKDLKKLHDQMPAPLQSIEILTTTLSSMSAVAPSATLRVGLPRNFASEKNPQKLEEPTVLAQFPLNMDFDMNNAMELIGKPLTPFELKIPQGINLQPLGQHEDLFLGKTEQEGQLYLLAASSPELLLTVASNTNLQEEPRRLNEGLLWIKMEIDPRDLPEYEADSFSAPIRIEYDVDASEKALVTKIHVNTREIAPHIFSTDAALLQQALHIPMIFGAGPLHMLVSWNNSFMSPDLTLQDLLKQYRSLITPDIEQDLEDAALGYQEFLGVLGVQWSDLLAVLRGTVTMGLVGSVDSPWGPLPGFYLHLGGAGEELKTVLMTSVELLASSANPYMQGLRAAEGPTWKGFTTPPELPMQASLLSLPEGLVFTTLPVEQFFSGKTQRSATMKVITDRPHISSVGIDVASLLPLVQKLWKNYGGKFLQAMAEQKNPVTQSDVHRVLTLLFQWSDVIVTASDNENGELRLVVNTEPPVVHLDVLQGASQTTVRAYDEATHSTSSPSDSQKEVPQK